MSRTNWKKAVDEWLQGKSASEVEHYRQEITESGFCSDFHESLAGESRGLYMAAMKKSQRRQKSPRAAAEVIPVAQPSSVKRKRGHRKKCSILSDRSRRKTEQKVTNRARKEAADAAPANAWRQVEAKEAAARANIRERLDEAKLMNRCGTPHQAASNRLVEIINVLGLMNMHDWSYVQVNWQWLVCGMYRLLTGGVTTVGGSGPY